MTAGSHEKSTFEMTHAELRALRVFWPESLSDAQLARERAYLLTRQPDFAHNLWLVEEELAARAKGSSQ